MRHSQAISFVLLLLTAAAAAQPPASSKKKKAEAPAAEEGAPEADMSSVHDGKKRVEAYLAQRTKKLQDALAARLAFSSQENLVWDEFWSKDRDARKMFELRTARQVLALFSTLETLDPKDHASTISDFDRLRSTMVRSFESQQKQKMFEFFIAREARWRQFSDAQERDRAAFAAEAESSWQDDKSFLRTIYSPNSPQAAAPASSAASSRAVP